MLINHIHSAAIRQIVVIIIIKKCLMHFDPDDRVFAISN